MEDLVDMENLGYSLRLPEGNIYDAPCPLLRTLSVIGGKWKLPLLWHIADYTEAGSGVRYNALKRAVHGITNTMLNKCLAELERDGLILREEQGKKASACGISPDRTWPGSPACPAGTVCMGAGAAGKDVRGVNRKPTLFLGVLLLKISAGQDPMFRPAGSTPSRGFSLAPLD